MTHWSLNIPAETLTWCWGAKCFCQGVRERHHQSPGCASIAYRLIQELVFWRDYISGAQLIRGLLAIRLFYSSSWEGGFLYNLEPLLHSWAGMWSSWWAVCTKTCCLRSSITFPHCHFFSQVLVLCPMEMLETNLPALTPELSLQIKHKKEEYLSLAPEFSSVFLLSCNFTAITAVTVWLCSHCLAVRLCTTVQAVWWPMGPLGLL